MNAGEWAEDEFLEKLHVFPFLNGFNLEIADYGWDDGFLLENSETLSDAVSWASSERHKRVMVSPFNVLRQESIGIELFCVFKEPKWTRKVEKIKTNEIGAFRIGITFHLDEWNKFEAPRLRSLGFWIRLKNYERVLVVRKMNIYKIDSWKNIFYLEIFSPSSISSFILRLMLGTEG